MKLLLIFEMFVLKKWIGRCVQKRHCRFLSILHLLTVALFGFLLFMVVHYIFSLPSTINNTEISFLGRTVELMFWTWLLQQAHANQNHSRACFMSLKKLVLPGAEVPYLLRNYRFLDWSLLAFRIKLPFFPLLTWKPPPYFSCSPCLLAC